jgi:hypothetical protein
VITIATFDKTSTVGDLEYIILYIKNQIPRMEQGSTFYFLSPTESLQAAEARDWAALPQDILLDIFLRLGPREVMLGAEFACKPWRSVALRNPSCGAASVWRWRAPPTNFRHGEDAVVGEGPGASRYNNSTYHGECGACGVI